jgi:AraC-like DNA-binding protein/TolB-like protein
VRCIGAIRFPPSSPFAAQIYRLVTPDCLHRSQSSREGEDKSVWTGSAAGLGKNVGGSRLSRRESDSAAFIDRPRIPETDGAGQARLLRAVGRGAREGSSMDGIERGQLIKPDSPRLLPQHVKRALDYMRGNMAERITLAGLASACGASERTLLKQFQRFVGLPPLAYLRRLRLNVARNELTSAENNDVISDVAIRCGLSHLGRFATEYRRLFGETPSATRRRVRGRVADETLAKQRASCSGDSTPSPSAAVGRGQPSLLILPLRTETLRESLEARDLTERLAATLSRMRIASVASANPSRTYSVNAPQPRNARTQYCLLGRLTQCDERTRVIVRLVDVAADRHLWGDSFDGSASDPFELQDRVVDGVLCGVVSHLSDAEIERAYSKDPRDLGARDLALQALPLILGTSASNARRAMAILDHAMALDAADATSTALLACCHAPLAIYHGTPSPAAARDTALELSRRAGMLDNSDPLVTTARSTATALAFQPDEAEALITRALAMDPTSAWAWERRGFLRLNSPADADLAMTDFRRALQLRGPGLSRANCFVGIATVHCFAGRRAETDLWTRKALADNPGATWIYRWQSCYSAKWRDKSALMAAVEHLRRAQPEFSVSLMMACLPPADPDWLDALTQAGMSLT